MGAVVTFLAGTESMDSVRRLAEEARAEFEATADELGIGLSWLALAHVHHNACRWQQRHQALERAHLHGVRARDVYLQEHSILWMAAGPVYGPMPTDEGLRWFDAHATDLENIPVMAALRAVVEAMVGNFDGARTLMRNATARLEELGQHLWLAGLSMETLRSRCSPAIPQPPRARRSQAARPSRHRRTRLAIDNRRSDSARAPGGRPR